MPRANAPTIVTTDLAKVFVSGGGAVWALRDVNVEVPAGSFTCIVGPSGCGKSTLLRIFGSLLEPTLGEVRHSRTDGDAASRPAFVFQEHGVFPWSNVVDNVAFGLRMQGVGKRERRSIALRWVDRVGLSDFAAAFPHQLSGGMRQRVAIARAFATDSPLLLMDEPLGALDAQTRMVMQEELLSLWEADRKTVVLVTHSLEEALLLGDRVVVMSSRPGTVQAEIDVPFARPRRMEIERTAQFGELRHQLWELLRPALELEATG